MIKNGKKLPWQFLLFVVLLIIVSHPELRLFFPLIDALGVDVLLTLLSVQFISLFGDYVKPLFGLFYRKVFCAVAGKLHSLFIFLGGSFGHFLTVKFYYWHSKVLPDYAITKSST